MTKIIVHIYVKNLLKVLKLLKTRKRTRNGFSRIPLRSIRQGAKAPFKTKEQGERVTKLLQSSKIVEKTIDKWYNKIKEKGESRK
jgi:hypothetical protein